MNSPPNEHADLDISITGGEAIATPPSRLDHRLDQQQHRRNAADANAADLFARNGRPLPPQCPTGGSTSVPALADRTAPPNALTATPSPPRVGAGGKGQGRSTMWRRLWC
jgi:hypothetical protein